MLPVVALVGRANVGKSTLFNCLTRTRDALVADQPGLTRDRKYGVGRLGPRPYVVVDTGGLTGESNGLGLLLERQVGYAIAEADRILFVVDAKEGMSAVDQSIAGQLRRTGKPVTLVVNKSEGRSAGEAAAEFHELGLGAPVAVAAAHGQGVKGMIEQVLETLAEPAPGVQPPLDGGVLIAVVGRPNVGKSTLVNRLLGEERVLTYDQPGTTRDSIFIPLRHGDTAYTLIDTAGVRRRARIQEAVEKFSVIKTLQAIEQAHVVLMVVDAAEGVGEQDATLAGHVLDSGRGAALVVNKWDRLDAEQRRALKAEIDRKLPFLDFAPRRFISALRGSGVGGLFAVVDRVYANAVRKLSTPEVTRILEGAVAEHQPPLVRGRRIKLRYAHQGGQNPPTIVIHGNQTEELPAAYRRYLVNRFREALQLEGTPLRLELRSGQNPFHGRHNPLTERQQRKRKRLLKFVARGKR